MNNGDGPRINPVRFLTYCFSQIFEELRLFILSITWILLPREKRNLLRCVKEKGYVVLNDALTKGEIELIRSDINKNIRPLLSQKDVPGMSRRKGSVRLRRPEQISAPFLMLSRDFKWILLNFFYTGKFSGPVLMLSFTEKLDGEGIQIFADHPHFDSYRHQLKVVIALTDVNEANGPTEFAAISPNYHYPYWKEYYSSWLTEKKMRRDKTKTISDGYFNKFGPTEKLTMSAGDIAIFDSRHLHRASCLSEGSRELLWFYF